MDLLNKRTICRVAFIPLLVALVCILPYASGYAEYRDQIPNGHNVMHPCKVNIRWFGVGHMNPQGGGSRNPFGVDFASNGHKWKETLCKMDSDGDGRSNGEELGDPNCRWRVGENPEQSENITHPGICEPVDDPKCKHSDTKLCDYEDLDCPAVKNETDIVYHNLTFIESEVPAEETTYVCQFFDVSDIGLHHAIASKPLIDNRNVMHHMVLWGCLDDSNRHRYKKPSRCGMAPTNCFHFLIGWALGNNGRCFHKDVGLTLGGDSWKYLVLQSHWNNPKLIKGYRDASGMQLVLTPHLRKHNESGLILGQNQLYIPPKRASFQITASARHDCTKAYLKTPVAIYYVWLHMHYLGSRGLLEQWRDGKKLKDIVYDNPFNYDYPVFHDIKPAIEFLPGDELKLTCDFNSMRKDTMTYWGEATLDEMCFAFIFMTPEHPEFSFSIDYGTIDTCSSALTSYGGCPPLNLGFVSGTKCHMGSFSQRERAQIIAQINDHCTDVNGCSQQCVKPLREYRSHPCINTTDLSIPRYIESEFRLPDNIKKMLKYWLDKCKDKPVPPVDKNAAPTALPSSLKIAFVIQLYLLLFVRF